MEWNRESRMKRPLIIFLAQAKKRHFDRGEGDNQHHWEKEHNLSFAEFASSGPMASSFLRLDPDLYPFHRYIQ
jgi:hypothetical protein